MLAFSLTIESVYRFGPGLLDPHGNWSVPGNGAGLAVPTYMFPWLSNAGEYHSPPPELIEMFSVDHRFSGAVSKCHSFFPVLASSAHRMPTPSPP